MKMTDEQIQAEINEIIADERLSYKTATVFENAPLAMIQLTMETKLHTLEKVLGVPLTNISELRLNKKKRERYHQ